MKTLFTLLFSFFTLSAFSQVAEPAIISIKGYGGNGTEQISPLVVKTEDNGFIIGHL